MKIIDKMMSRLGFEKKQNLFDIYNNQTLFPGFQDQYGQSTPDNYQRHLSAYGNQIWAYACTYIISTTIAGLPWRLYRKTRNDKTTINNPRIESIFERPNQNDENSTWYNLIEWTVANLELTGNAYWLLDGVRAGGIPQAIYILPVDRMRVKASTVAGQLVDSYRLIMPGKTDPIIYSPKEVTHFKYMKPNDPFYGQGSFGPSRFSSQNVSEAILTNLNIFSNGAKIGGVLETEASLNQETFDRLKQRINEQYSGRRNAHKMAILEGGLKYKDIGANLKDLEYIEGTKLSREDICATFGVPPVLVGILDKATYSNYKEAVKVFMIFCILPKLARIEQVITQVAQIYDPNIRFEFVTSDVEALKDDMDVKSQVVMRYWQMGVPFNELIKKFDLPFDAIEGGDNGYLPFSVQPIDKVEENAEPQSSNSGMENIGDVPENQGTGEEPQPPDNGQQASADEAAGKSAAGQIEKQYSKERKAAIWKQFDRQLSQIENRYIKEIEVFFRGLYLQVLTNLKREKSITKFRLDTIIYNASAEILAWAKTSRKYHGAAFKTNADREFSNLGLNISFDLRNPAAVTYIRNFSLDMAKEVIGTNAKELRESLAAGMDAGESIPEITKRVQEIYTPYFEDKYKATRIARTEVLAASNEGALQSYEQAAAEGIVVKKAWLATPDGRVRENHLAAGVKYDENNAIPIREPFILPGTGASGDAPGNMDNPGDSINCRCTVIPVVVR